MAVLGQSLIPFLHKYSMNAPEFDDGYVYYIRFKTPKGIFYKIGFTRMSSAELRFSYGGSENYKMIDKVLMYKYSLKALEYEQKLHHDLRHDRAYKRYGLSSIFIDPKKHPLFQDGQTELYREDVLGLDPDYKKPFNLMILVRPRREDLIARRQLKLNWHESVREEMERRTYSMLEEFISAPLFFSREEFLEREGAWVVSLHRWASQNAMTARLDNETTAHGALPLPHTKNELLALDTFAPGWCKVSSIPPEIVHLKNLTTIRIRSTDVASIPDEVYTLPKLTELDISNSRVRRITSGIAKLQTLEVLDISFCEEFEYLPPELERLPALKEVRIQPEEYDRVVGFFPTKPELLIYLAYNPLLGSYEPTSGPPSRETNPA